MNSDNLMWVEYIDGWVDKWICWGVVWNGENILVELVIVIGC